MSDILNEKRTLHMQAEEEDYGLKLNKGAAAPRRRLFCSQCGTQLLEGDKFCFACGAAVIARSAQPSGAYTPQPAQMTPPVFTEKEQPAQTQKPARKSRFIPQEPEAYVEEMPISWGKKMPREENQFNFQGDFSEYFSYIFQEDFPEYDIECDYKKKGFFKSEQDSAVYTFRKNGRIALIVQVMPENSTAYRLRKDCEKNGIPYLRFYHNHDGWWNTRAYCRARVRTKLYY